MADLYRPFDPGLRVMQNSVLVAGPYYLAPMTTANTVGGPGVGIWLGACEIEYVPELRGPWLNSNYAWRWTLLGYRPQISLHVALAKDNDTDYNNGISVLRNLYTLSFRQSEGYQLEFNAFATNAQYSAWRAVMFEGAFEPKKVSGKATTGWEIEFKLKTQALVQAADMGHWKDWLW